MFFLAMFERSVEIEINFVSSSIVSTDWLISRKLYSGYK